MQNFLEDIANHDIEASFKLKPTPADPEKDSLGPVDSAILSNRWMWLATTTWPGVTPDDQTRFPDRVIAGTETWGHMMYTFWKETERLPHVIGDFVWTAIDYLGEAGGGEVNFEGKVRMGGVPFPYHTSGIGDFNICGFKRPQSYYRDLLWGMRSGAVHHRPRSAAPRQTAGLHPLGLGTGARHLDLPRAGGQARAGGCVCDRRGGRAAGQRRLGGPQTGGAAVPE